MVGLFLAGILFSLQGCPQDDAPSAVPVPLAGFIWRIPVKNKAPGDKYCRIEKALEACPDSRPLAGNGWEKNEEIISLESREIDWEKLIHSFLEGKLGWS